MFNHVQFELLAGHIPQNLHVLISNLHFEVEYRSLDLGTITVMGGCVRAKVMVAAALVASIGASAQISIVGEFSNMRYTEEHAYGYSVELWRNGATIFGLFLASAGLAGDTPTGVLENVKFDPATGKLSFQAKLTMGSHVLAGGKLEQSRDLLEFDGTLSRRELTGSLKHSDQSALARTKRVRLRRQAESSMDLPKSYDDWKAQVSEILRFRGPKW